MVSTWAQARRRRAHRSTLLAGTGVGLIALGIVLTLAHVLGNVVPTVLALVGAGLLVAGLATGTLLVFDNLRWRRDESYYDPDDERDEQRPVVSAVRGRRRRCGPCRYAAPRP